jgi:AcrR family transcriptional regulator
MTDLTPPRTQTERRAATRAALIEAARPLFAERGYAHVGTEEIVRAAGVTRGALYHHFDGKDGLFTAVFEAVEAELLTRIAEHAESAGTASPLATLHVGMDAMLDAALDPGLAQIVLIDAPAVLGWEAWREIGWRYGMGLTESVLAAAMEAGELPRRPVRPLAHVLLGALDEATLYVARAEDQRTARADMADTMSALLDGLRA